MKFTIEIDKESIITILEDGEFKDTFEIENFFQDCINDIVSEKVMDIEYKKTNYHG